MSKVICPIDIPKSKLLRRNRRAETRNKKAQRGHMAKYYGGYWLQTESTDRIHERVDVPEETKTLTHFEYKGFEPVTDSNGQVVGVKPIITYTEETITIPAHKRRVCIGYKTRVFNKPIVKRADENKTILKPYKKQAARQLRRRLNNNPELVKSIGSNYKKDFDVFWSAY